MKIENIELKSLPAPIYKILNFDAEGIHFEMRITEDILIPIPDSPFLGMNVYKDVACIIARATKNGKPIARLESPIFKKEEILNKWEEVKIKFIERAVEISLVCDDNIFPPKKVISV